MKRREFVVKSVAAGMMAPLAARGSAFAAATSAAQTSPYVNTICTFSKTFEWMGYDELAGFLAEAGFDGIDLSVRPGGHVLPENVERDLPLAVKAAKSQGLSIPMMVTAITDAASPFTERVLKTASEQGVKYYRLGYYRYDNNVAIGQNLDNVRKQLEALSRLNEKYGVQGGYQNHTGVNVGAPVWDIFMLLNELDPRYIGCQYDVRHAAAEGISSWPLGFRAVARHVKHECIKDYVYVQNNNGRWGVRSVPLGTGAVDFNRYFALRKELGVNGPLSYHFEFDLGDDAALPARERMKRLMPVVSKEVETLKSLLKNTI